MASSIIRRVVTWVTSRSLLYLTILLLFCASIWLALVLPKALSPISNSLAINTVVSQDYQAPRSLSFESQILTEQAQNQVENAVQPIYLPADPSITRRQIERLQVVLNYVSTVRLDSYASIQQKLEDLISLSDLNISDEIADRLLTISDSRWQVIQQEALSVLEQIERNTIREDQLLSTKQRVPSLISFSLSEEEALIVVALVQPLIVPNSLYSEDLTRAARIEAREAVQPVVRSFVAGENIILGGEVVTPLKFEALSEFGLVGEPSTSVTYLSALAFVLVLAIFLSLYFKLRKDRTILGRVPALLLLMFSFLVFLYAARFTMPERTIIPYIIPLPAFGLAVAGLYSTEISLVSSLLLSTLAVYGLPHELDLTLYYVFTSLIGILALNKGRRISSFFWAGIAIGITGSAIIIAFRLPDGMTDWIGMATLIVAAIFNGFASASLSFIIRFIFSQILGVLTPFQLLEISRPDHPLLQNMLRNAPGTYQHSLQVANLAERAAETIGADALLTRVGALFHDAGKANNPSFFIENNPPGTPNPHNELDPTTSASIIINHVQEGVQLARKYRLPERIQDFIREHHGTLVTTYQYSKAVNNAGRSAADPVDLDPFRYPGPSPRSKETALLMLADQCEARARAELPTNETNLQALLKDQFDYCQREGQLDHSPLTLLDLTIARDSFVKTLTASHHIRIKYPHIKTPLIKDDLIAKQAGQLILGSISPRNHKVKVTEKKNK